VLYQHNYTTLFATTWRNLKILQFIMFSILETDLLVEKFGETLLSPSAWNHVRFEVFTAVTMKNGVFWDVTPCGSCKNRCFGGT
jgi:hypothetical protein